MEGNLPRQEIFLTIQVMLSTKHTLFTNFLGTYEDSDIPGNFSNQFMKSVSPPEMSMLGERLTSSKFLEIHFNTKKLCI